MSDPNAGIDALADLLKQGDRITAERLLPLVYEDLRQLARGRIARLAPGKTMRATELVHEAWMRIVAGGDPGWRTRPGRAAPDGGFPCERSGRQSLDETGLAVSHGCSADDPVPGI